ncbi:MR-MLE family protein [Salmonella enterica]|nr:MR-MLE family protein [Salmonella enterica]KJU05790.1 mandelate racemase [Salmonella enterica subsp. enterica serovar Heidelberg str. 77-1831]
MSSYNPVLIRVNTDSGLSGIGEVGLAYGAGAKAGVGIIRDLAPLIVGEDPLNIEKIWEFFFRKTFLGDGGRERFLCRNERY